jgi:uncharacterized protein YgiM (DUF1202 family)
MSFSKYNAFQKKIYDLKALPNPVAWVVKSKAEMCTGNAGKPGTNKIIKRLPKGAKVEVLQTAEPWCKIKYKGREGYIQTAHITFEQGKMNSTSKAHIIKSTTWMFETASSKAAKITKVPTLSSVKVLEPSKSGWTKIQYWYDIGYIQTKYLKKGWGVIRE